MANDTGMAFEACARIRRSSLVADFPQSLVRPSLFQNIDPRDGKVGGYLYMGSPDAFARWSVSTVQDRVTVVTSRKTGPASWSRVWIAGGAAVHVEVPLVSNTGVRQSDGVTPLPALTAVPTLNCWFDPYSNNAPFETMPLSFGNNPWDTFAQLAPGFGTLVGYCPRLTRNLFVVSRAAPASLQIQLGINFTPYGDVTVNDQGGIWVDSWTSVSITNTGLGALNALASWSNTSSDITNP
jgi:hypothetical protein